MSNMPVPIPEYKNVMRMTEENITAMTAAFKHDDFRTAHSIAYAIGRLYAPESNYYADRIAHLVNQVFSVAYWAGAEDQRQKLSERAFTPPF